MRQVYSAVITHQYTYVYVSRFYPPICLWTCIHIHNVQMSGMSPVIAVLFFSSQLSTRCPGWPIGRACQRFGRWSLTFHASTYMHKSMCVCVCVRWVMYALTHELTARHRRYEIKIDFNDVESFSEMWKKLRLISHYSPEAREDIVVIKVGSL